MSIHGLKKKQCHSKKTNDLCFIDGDHSYSGVRADYYTVAVRTGDPGFGGISLLLVEKDTPGFTVGRKLKKMSQDELNEKALLYRLASWPNLTQLLFLYSISTPDAAVWWAQAWGAAWPAPSTPIRSTASASP